MSKWSLENGEEIFRSGGRRWVKSILSREDTKNKNIEAKQPVCIMQERGDNLVLAGVESEKWWDM